jgi:hypothetical protein
VTHNSSSLRRAYLRRCKHSSPEQKLTWLAAAVDFARATRHARGASEPAKERLAS